VQSAIIVRAHAALESGDALRAESLAKLASGLGGTADLNDLKEAIAQLQSKQSATTTVAVNSLVTVKPLKLDYPKSALVGGVEGWVDLAFDVTGEGKVANVIVVNASPRNVFESAAKNAMSRVRFQPVMRNGQAIPVKSTLHVVFRLNQP
jgi:TonB family protein